MPNPSSPEAPASPSAPSPTSPDIGPPAPSPAVMPSPDAAPTSPDPAAPSAPVMPSPDAAPTSPDPAAPSAPVMPSPDAAPTSPDDAPTSPDPAEPSAPVDMPSPTIPTAPSPPAPPVAGPDGCSTVNGDFGTLQGEQQLVVPFLYSVELTEDISQSDFLLGVVPGLETSMNDFLVPVLFEGIECSATPNLFGERAGNIKGEGGNTRGRRRLAATVVGMSALPLDSVSDEVDCGDLANCFGMLGQVTLYLEGTNANRRRGRRRDLQDTTEADKLRSALQQGMSEGAFDNNPPILRVRYVEDGGSDTDGDDDINRGIEDPSTVSSDSNEVNAALVAPLVVVGALALVVLTAILVRRRRKPAELDAEDAASGGEQDTLVTSGEDKTVQTASVAAATTTTSATQPPSSEPALSPSVPMTRRDSDIVSLPE